MFGSNGVASSTMGFVDGGVDPHRRGEHDPAGVGAPSRLEHADRADRVERDAVDRRVEDVVDVGHGGEVEDRVGAGHRLGQPVLVEHVDRRPTRRRRGAAASGRARARVQPASSRASTTCVPMNPDPPVTATILSRVLSTVRLPGAAPSEAMTWSASSSVITADIGRQMWRAQMRSAPGSGPSAHGSKTGWRCSGVLVHLARQPDAVLVAQQLLELRPDRRRRAGTRRTCSSCSAPSSGIVERRAAAVDASAVVVHAWRCAGDGR